MDSPFTDKMGSLITEWESRTQSTDDDLSTASPYYRTYERTYDVADATAFLGPSTSGVIRNVGVSDDVSYESRAPPSTSATSENNYAEIPNQDGINGIKPSPSDNLHSSKPNTSVNNSNFSFMARFRPFSDKSDVTFENVQRQQDSTGSGNVSSNSQTTDSSFQLKASPFSQNLNQSSISTIPLPLNTRRSHISTDSSSFFQYGSHSNVKKDRSVLHTVIAVAIAGLVYIAIGIIAGYFIFKKDCPEYIASKSYFLRDNQNEQNFTEILTTASSTPSIVSTTQSISTTQTTEASPQPGCTAEKHWCKCGPFGGDSEREFNDNTTYRQHGNITSFSVNHNEYFIGSLRFWYGKTAGPQHGYTTSGYEVKVDLANNEIITDVHVDFTSGKPFLTRLQIRTNLRVLGPYGGRGGEQMISQGKRLLFIAGKAGAMVDQIVMYYSKCNS